MSASYTKTKTYLKKKKERKKLLKGTKRKRVYSYCSHNLSLSIPFDLSPSQALSTRSTNLFIHWCVCVCVVWCGVVWCGVVWCVFLQKKSFASCLLESLAAAKALQATRSLEKSCLPRASVWPAEPRHASADVAPSRRKEWCSG